MKSNRRTRFRRSLSGVLAAVLLLAGLLPAQAARAQGASPVPYTVEECDQIDESKMHDELRRITKSVFDEERDSLSVADIVKRNWNDLGLDATVNAVVNAAHARVRDEIGWWGRITSLTPANTKKLTKRIAAYAFGSPEFEEALERLSHATSADVAAEIQLMAVKSASSALNCVLAYLDGAVSPTMAAILKTQIIAEATVPSGEEVEGAGDWLDIAEANPGLIGGVGVLIGTRLAVTLGKALAGKIANRVGLALLTRLATGAIPLVGAIIGIALIIVDLIALREGALPAIRDALKKPEIKEEIRDEVTTTFKEDLNANLTNTAGDIADAIFSQWQAFRDKYARVLDLARANPTFQALLNETPADKVPALDELVALFDELLGEERLLQAIESGRFERIFHLPAEAQEILRANKDPALVVAWADLADNLLNKVVALEVYRVASPSDFSGRLALKTILDLDDPDLIRKLLLLDDNVRRTLLALPLPQIRELLESVAPDDLAWLARELLPTLDPQQWSQAVDRFLRALALARANPSFQDILKATLTDVDMVKKLGALVALFDELLGEERLLQAIESGRFERILYLPAEAQEILRATEDPALVVAWADLAEDLIVPVVKTELYTVASPSDFEGPKALERVLALEDPGLIQELMRLDADARRIVLELPSPQIEELLESVDPVPLAWLTSELLPTLEPQQWSQAVDRFLRALALARANPAFQAILDATSADVDMVKKLGSLVALFDELLGEERLLQTIESGQFERILHLPTEAQEILRATEDPALVVAWADLADNLLSKVVALEVYRVASPYEFSGRPDLEALLALNDPDLIRQHIRLDDAVKNASNVEESEKASAAIVAAKTAQAQEDAPKPQPTPTPSTEDPSAGWQNYIYPLASALALAAALIILFGAWRGLRARPRIANNNKSQSF